MHAKIIFGKKKKKKSNLFPLFKRGLARSFVTGDKWKRIYTKMLNFYEKICSRIAGVRRIKKKEKKLFPRRISMMGFYDFCNFISIAI